MKQLHRQYSPLTSSIVLWSLKKHQEALKKHSKEALPCLNVQNPVEIL